MDDKGNPFLSRKTKKLAAIARGLDGSKIKREEFPQKQIRVHRQNAFNCTVRSAGTSVLQRAFVSSGAYSNSTRDPELSFSVTGQKKVILFATLFRVLRSLSRDSAFGKKTISGLACVGEKRTKDGDNLILMMMCRLLNFLKFQSAMKEICHFSAISFSHNLFRTMMTPLFQIGLDSEAFCSNSLASSSYF
jgi:hypothetical protein